MPYTKQEKIHQLHATKDVVANGIIWAPQAFMAQSVSELLDICNGCGAAGAKFDFVPDRIYGTYVGHACHIHDFMYFTGTTTSHKESADRIMRDNMLRLVELAAKETWYKPLRLMRSRVQTYYYAVSKFGGPAYWEGKD